MQRRSAHPCGRALRFLPIYRPAALRPAFPRVARGGSRPARAVLRGNNEGVFGGRLQDVLEETNDLLRVAEAAPIVKLRIHLLQLPYFVTGIVPRSAG